MSIIPLDNVEVTITIDELDILSVREGDRAEVTVDAIPGTSFEGTVKELNTVSSNNGGNSKFTAVVSLPRDERMLYGMNASILITVKTDENVLTIPAEALSEEKGKTFVYTAFEDEELMNPVEVTTGASDGKNVQIVAGLEEGQVYWYSYYDTPTGDVYENFDNRGRENAGRFNPKSA